MTRQLSDAAVARSGAEFSIGAYENKRAGPVSDLMIKQVRSGFTSSRRTRDMLRDVGLRHIGDTILRYSRDRAKLRPQLRAVKHLVDVWPVAAIPGVLRDISGVGYSVGGKPAKSFEISAEEHFEVEVCDGFVAMGWPTDITLLFLLQWFDVVAPPAHPDVAILYSRNRGREIHSGKSGMQALHSDPTEYIFARLEYPDFTVTWENGNVTPEPEDGVRYGEFGWLSSRYLQTEVKALLEKTGTVEIRLIADELSNKADFVKEYVKQGSVLRLDKTS